MPSFADRIKDTTATTGTGSITLDGTPPTGFASFDSAFLDGRPSAVPFPYAIFSADAEWEVGTGLLTSATVMTRAPTASSNSGALVSFSAGSKTVICTISAAHMQATRTMGQIMAIPLSMP